MPWTLSAFADECAGEGAAQIAGLVRARIQHIDIRTIDGVNISVLPLDQARRFRAQLDAAAISVGMFASPLGKIDVADPLEGDLERLRHLAELAPILNCRAVRLFSYYNAKGGNAGTGLSPVEFRREALRRLQALKDLARELNLILYHENESHIFGDRAEDVLAIARELRDGVTFRTIFDFGNFNAARENVWDNWVKLRDFTDAFHIKDNLWLPTEAADGGKLVHVPAGHGGGFVREIIADAVKRRFSGPVCIEPHLVHSPAVLATGPSGVASRTFATMSAEDCFQIACDAGREALVAAGAVID